GIITGIIPGIHINLVSVLVVSVSGYIIGFTSPLMLGTFIIAMAITHTFLNIIPAVFLGAPEGDTALGVLPGHKLLLEGKGHEAVKLNVIGSLFSLLICIAIVPLLNILIPAAYELLKNWIGYILLAVVVIMILREKNLNNKFWAFILFTLTGVLGLVIFKINIKNSLFPLLSGLFGASMLIMSINKNTTIPEQKLTETIKIKKIETAKSLGSGVFSGSLVSFFPGLGPAQAAVIGSELTRNQGAHSFLIMLGGINTVNMLVSMLMLYTIGKTRTGALVAVSEIMDVINLKSLLIFICVALTVAGVAAFLALSISKKFAKFITKINYKIMCLSIILFIAGLTLFLSGYIGLLIFIIATAVGIIPNILGIRRSHMMGCLLLPVILWFIL
ncbi:tripartite tricarboxylate transporter permease, partial [Candidatus Woesearchaeota archaeon]|nr:tripartite tricarboxylate transporter permease [Candidatus Woesearchaeota archaeon]